MFLGQTLLPSFHTLFDKLLQCCCMSWSTSILSWLHIIVVALDNAFDSLFWTLIMANALSQLPFVWFSTLFIVVSFPFTCQTCPRSVMTLWMTIVWSSTVMIASTCIFSLGVGWIVNHHQCRVSSWWQCWLLTLVYSFFCYYMEVCIYCSNSFQWIWGTSTPFNHFLQLVEVLQSLILFSLLDMSCCSSCWTCLVLYQHKNSRFGTSSFFTSAIHVSLISRSHLSMLPYFVDDAGILIPTIRPIVNRATTPRRIARIVVAMWTMIPH